MLKVNFYIFGVLVVLYGTIFWPSIKAQEDKEVIPDCCNENITIPFAPEEEIGQNETDLLLESNDPRNVSFYLYPDPE